MANTTVKRQYTKLVNDNNDLEIEHFETDADIVLVEKGSGKYQGQASNVQDALKELYTMAETGGVTGVKGDAEDSYRTGNVSLSPANIGAVSKSDIGYVEISNVGVTLTDAQKLELKKKQCIVNVAYGGNSTYFYKVGGSENDAWATFVNYSGAALDNSYSVSTRYLRWYEGSDTPNKFEYDESSVIFYSTTYINTALNAKLDKKPDGTNDLITNNKIAVSYLPDIVLGQLVYGGTVTGAGVATLSTNAKTKLGTSSNNITLTNNTTATTGYAANEGIFYVVSDDGNFASLGLKTGDWLISVGSAWKKIDNTDEVTSVTVAATGPVVSSTSTSQTGNVSTTISLADNYGDTKNPYASKTKNYVLAAPSSANGAPSFRALTAADIPNLSSIYQPKDADLTAIAGLTGTSGLLKKTAADTWTLDTASYLTGNQTITVTGDATGSGTTSIALTLANSGVTAGTYSAVTVNSKGLVTAGAKTIEFGTSGQTTPSASLAIGGIFLKQL